MSYTSVYRDFVHGVKLNSSINKQGMSNLSDLRTWYSSIECLLPNSGLIFEQALYKFPF